MLKIGLCDSGLYLGFDNFYCAYIHRLKADWASLWNSLLITIAIPSKNIICWNCKPFLSSTPTLTTFHTSTVCIHILCMRGCLKPSFILSNKHTKIRLLRRPKIGNIPNTVFQRTFWQNRLWYDTEWLVLLYIFWKDMTQHQYKIGRRIIKISYGL